MKVLLVLLADCETAGHAERGSAAVSGGVTPRGLYCALPQLPLVMCARVPICKFVHRASPDGALEQAGIY